MKAPREGFFIPLILNFLKAEDGATAIEYGLIAALTAVVIITGVTAVSNRSNCCDASSH
jgi:hypothetical protein